MNPHTQITSIKAATPPRAGDRYEHRIYGKVKLVKSAGGDLWHCSVDAYAPNVRLILRPAAMKRIHEE